MSAFQCSKPVLGPWPAATESRMTDGRYVLGNADQVGLHELAARMFTAGGDFWGVS